MPQKSLIVVGAGLAGLSAAVLAAKKGMRVTLVEQGSHLGGRASTEIQDGFHHNVGPHAIYMAGPAARLLKDLQIFPKGKMVPPTGWVVLKDKLHPLPASPRALFTSRLFGFRSKFRMASVLSKASQWPLEEHHAMSFGAWVAQQSSDENLRLMLRALGRVSSYAGDLEQLSAGVGLSQMRLAFAKGVLYADGGWSQIVESLKAAFLEAGGNLFTSTPAEEVMVHPASGKAHGVMLKNGELLQGDFVLLAVGPAQAARLAGEARCPGLYVQTERLMPIRAACLDLALSTLPDPTRTFALGLDEPLYFSVHSNHARLAPEGKHLVSLAIYLEGPPPAKEASVHRLEAWMDLLQPGWRAHELHRRMLPSATVTHALPTAAMGGLAGRPPVAVAECPGLFLAGDWVGDQGHLADAAIASAKHAVSCMT